MATATSTASDPSMMGADAKVRVTVESAAQPMSTQTGAGKEGQASMKNILASLAETRKYLPNQVYTFLDSMEGKTLDDLRVEAMHLANKAQEEAMKRASDVTSYGKSIIDSANQRVNEVTDSGKAVVDSANQKMHDVTDMAKDKATDLANNARDMVQPPIEKTKEATKSIATKGLEKGTELCMKGLKMTTERVTPIVTPVVTPVTTRARQYLPQPAEEFIKNNIEGKSMEELYENAITGTRKTLLNAKEEAKPATLIELAGEVKDATLNGSIFKNTLSLTEQLADSAFGKKEVPSTASMLRRMYNLSTRVVGGVTSYANNKFNDMAGQALDAVSDRAYNVVDMTRGMTMTRVNQATNMVKPYAERIGSLPVIPSFVYRLLRGPSPAQMQGESAESSSTKTTKSASKMVPTTTVKVDIVGVEPKGTPQTSTSKESGSKTSSSSGSASMTAELKDSSKTTEGKGEPGMGVTTTGSESKNSNPNWPAGMTGAPQIESTTTEQDDEEVKTGKKKKQHHKA